MSGGIIESDGMRNPQIDPLLQALLEGEKRVRRGWGKRRVRGKGWEMGVGQGGRLKEMKGVDKQRGE